MNADDGQPARALTVEEMRRILLGGIRVALNYWLTADLGRPEFKEAIAGRGETRYRMEGMVHSILVMFDGCSMGIPALNITPDPHPTDEQFQRDLGKNWWTNNECHLHDLWYSMLGAVPIGERVPDDLAELEEVAHGAASDLAEYTARCGTPTWDDRLVGRMLARDPVIALRLPPVIAELRQRRASPAPPEARLRDTLRIDAVRLAALRWAAGHMRTDWAVGEAHIAADAIDDIIAAVPVVVTGKAMTTTSTDLTDEEIANWATGLPSNPRTEHGVRMAYEIQRWRQAGVDALGNGNLRIEEHAKIDQLEEGLRQATACLEANSDRSARLLWASSLRKEFLGDAIVAPSANEDLLAARERQKEDLLAARERIGKTIDALDKQLREILQHMAER